ncbi:MAG: acetylxylan esterase [Acidobacteria bacterium]|nr:acetylxylan esterase [Acidobacteriota bacterium]
MRKLAPLLLLAAPLLAGEVDVLDDLPNRRTMVAEYLARQAAPFEAKRDEEIAAIRSVEQLQAWQKRTRLRLIELLGGLPPETPLHPRVAGKLDRGDYRIEKIIYESQPRLYVTANLYLPAWKSVSPAFIAPVGHWPEGKVFEDYQRLGMEMARHGYILFVYDPIGQGERLENFDPITGQDRGGGSGTTAHTLIANQCFLIGETLTKHFVWDGIRAIDYLLTRPEVDHGHIGSMGASGGGTLTRYISAVDERVKISVPVVAAASKGGVAGSGDGEQNVPGNVFARIWGRDHWWLLPPRPLLNLNASEDHSFQTALASLEELKRAYGLFDREADAVVLEAQGRHGFIAEMRQSAFDFIDRFWDPHHDHTRPARVGEGTLEKPETLRATDTGQVWTSLGGATVFDINRQRAGEWLLASRGRVEPAEIRQFFDIPSYVSAMSVRRAGSLARDGYAIEKLVLESEPGVYVPALAFVPKGEGRRPAVLFLDDRGKAAQAGPGGELEQLAQRGYVALAVDVRGCGETSPGEPLAPNRTHDRMYRDFTLNPSTSLARGAMNLGRPLLGMRVHDALAAVQYLASRPDVDFNDLSVFGHREGGVISLFAAALDQRVRRAIAHRALIDFRALVENRYYAQPASLFIPGVLRRFDLPQVAAAAAPRRIVLINAVDGMGRRLAAPTVRVRYNNVTNLEAVVHDYPDTLIEIALSSERL